MPGEFLNLQSTIMCPHGGRAVLQTSNMKVHAVGAPVLLEREIQMVAGCPFMMGQKYSPCVRIKWKAGTTRSGCREGPVLTKSSIGQCLNAEGAIQGVATIVNTQMKVSGQ